MQRLGLDQEGLGEVLAVVGLFNMTNKLADGYRVEPDALDSLSRLLLSIALQRKVRCRDFNGIRELLILGHDAGLTNTPVCSQAAELLKRLTTFASITRGSAGACEATA